MRVKHLVKRKFCCGKTLEAACHVLDTLNVGLVMGRADRRHLGLRILSHMRAPALTGSTSLGVEEVASADGKAASQGD